MKKNFLRILAMLMCTRPQRIGILFSVMHNSSNNTAFDRPQPGKLPEETKTYCLKLST